MSLRSVKARNLAVQIENLLRQVDTCRLNVNRQIDTRQKVELGQFLTPMPVAQLMALMLKCSEPVI